MITLFLLAQLGAQQGLVEPNVASDSAMLAVPAITATVVEAIKGARPILSVVTLDSILAAQGLSKPQRNTVYGRMFVHVDVNRGSDAEFMLIPRMDATRLAGIKAGRPWKTFERIDPITQQYLFIPIELNTFTDDIMDTFASIGVGTSRWKREFKEYRPWTSKEQFEREIGKYVRARPTEVKRLWRYVIITP